MSSVHSDTTNSTGLNSLGYGTKIVGDLTTTNDIRLDGELEGNLKCSGKVILGAKGMVKGEIECQNAVIEGSVDGVLRVKELLHVKESALINGQIYTSKLMVQPGASFNVKCEMGGQKLEPKKIGAIKSA